MTRTLIVDNAYIMTKLVTRLNQESPEKHSFYLTKNAGQAYDKLRTMTFDAVIIDLSEDVVIRSGRTLGEILAEDYPSTTRIAWSDGPMNTPEGYHHRIRKTVQIKEIIQMADEMFLFPRYSI